MLPQTEYRSSTTTMTMMYKTQHNFQFQDTIPHSRQMQTCRQWSSSVHATLSPASAPWTLTDDTRLMALHPGLPGWAGTRKVKPIWISLKQETLSGSGISWAICKSAPRSRQITTPAPDHSVFYRPDALPAAQPTASKHWRTDECSIIVHSLYFALEVSPFRT